MGGVEEWVWEVLGERIVQIGSTLVFSLHGMTTLQVFHCREGCPTGRVRVGASLLME